MIKFSNKLKKPCFCPIFPIFGAKKIFPKNPALSCTTSHGILATCQNLEKINDTIPKKTPGQTGQKVRQKDEWADRPYFIGAFQLPLGVQKVLNNKINEKVI